MDYGGLAKGLKISSDSYLLFKQYNAHMYAVNKKLCRKEHAGLLTKRVHKC